MTNEEKVREMAEGFIIDAAEGVGAFTCAEVGEFAREVVSALDAATRKAERYEEALKRIAATMPKKATTSSAFDPPWLIARAALSGESTRG